MWNGKKCLATERAPREIPLHTAPMNCLVNLQVGQVLRGSGCLWFTLEFGAIGGDW